MVRRRVVLCSIVHSDPIPIKKSSTIRRHDRPLSMCSQPATCRFIVFYLTVLSQYSDVLNGYNGTVFAYGQTGSGKTFSMYEPTLFD